MKESVEGEGRGLGLQPVFFGEALLEGLRHRDDDVPEIAFPASALAQTGKAEDIGRPVPLQILPVELGDGLCPDKSQGYIGIIKSVFLNQPGEKPGALSPVDPVSMLEVEDLDHRFSSRWPVFSFFC